MDVHQVDALLLMLPFRMYVAGMLLPLLSSNAAIAKPISSGVPLTAAAHLVVPDVALWVVFGWWKR